jgi:hypothetical protein
MHPEILGKRAQDLAAMSGDSVRIAHAPVIRAYFNALFNHFSQMPSSLGDEDPFAHAWT